MSGGTAAPHVQVGPDWTGPTLTRDRIAVTFFSDEFATKKREAAVDLDALTNSIKHTSRPAKERLPWLKFARFGDVKTANGSLRHDANVNCLTGIEADYDAAMVNGRIISFAEAVATMQQAELSAIVYTSPRYTEDTQKWRILCPFSEERPPANRDLYMARLNGLFEGAFSLESWTLSQSYYFGSINQNPSHEAVRIEGICIDRADWLDLTAIGRPEKPQPKGGNGQHPPSRPEDITDKRIRGLVESLLDHVRHAGEREKYYTLRDIGYTFGGYLHLIGWTVEQAVTALIEALPNTVQDWEAARTTARKAVQAGKEKPLDLENRPNPGARRPYPANDDRPEETEAEPGALAETPLIVMRAGERHLAADAALAAMHSAGVPFYRRDKDLVRILRIKMKLSNGDEVFVPAVVAVTQPTLLRTLGHTVRWQKFNHKKEQVSVDPPTAVAEQILGMIDEWPFPPLRGVIATQTMRHDGTLLTQPGYDATTGLVLFEPPPMPPVPDQPTKRDALDALALLNGLLEEFVFAEDGNVSRSAAMSMIMTSTLRGAMSVAPMHVITKPEAGTGGSYLQDLVASIAIGERCPVMSLMPGDDKENEKRLQSAALTQQPIIALDNLSRTLMGDFLCQLIERPQVQVRRLGRNDDLVSVANSAFLMANGNNLIIGADTVRRVVQISLDADMENPETRSFKRNPVAEVLADRGRYVAAILTIARAYVVAGRPGRLSPLASFEDWSDLVRSAITWLGWPDPLQSASKVRAEDPIRNALLAVVSAWASELQVDIGYYTSELVRSASEALPDGERVRPALWEALSAVAGGKSGQIDSVKLGLWLNANLNRVIAGNKLIVDRETNKAKPRWLLVPR
jgi:putative DNA primase/helicase